ncbi:hypothetical protein VTI28DRAFT_8692 [Corynascus sepedonium]
MVRMYVRVCMYSTSMVCLQRTATVVEEFRIRFEASSHHFPQLPWLTRSGLQGQNDLGSWFGKYSTLVSEMRGCRLSSTGAELTRFICVCVPELGTCIHLCIPYLQTRCMPQNACKMLVRGRPSAGKRIADIPVFPRACHGSFRCLSSGPRLITYQVTRFIPKWAFPNILAQPHNLGLELCLSSYLYQTGP